MLSKKQFNGLCMILLCISSLCSAFVVGDQLLKPLPDTEVVVFSLFWSGLTLFFACICYRDFRRG